MAFHSCSGAGPRSSKAYLNPILSEKLQLPSVPGAH